MSQQYVTALKKHLQQGSSASLRPARGLGRRAVDIGLETLDMARIHEGALAVLKASGGRDGMTGRAEVFFSEAITPIEKTHRAALKANAHLIELKKTLGLRTVDLALSNRSLKEGVAQRKAVEKALTKGENHSKKLLQESRLLQKHLQQLTHRILSAQEDKRKKISRDLQDEIAQTLLGINVRLLTLKMDSAVNTAALEKEIASTQRLVDISMKTIKQIARGIGKQHET